MAALIEEIVASLLYGGGCGNVFLFIVRISSYVKFIFERKKNLLLPQECSGGDV